MARPHKRGAGFVGALLTATLAAALFSSTSADAGTAVSVFTLEDLSGFETTLTVDGLRELAPATPFGQFGFSEVEQQLIRGLTMPINPPLYAFGDNQDVPPVIDPSGTDPIGMGSMQVMFQPGQIPAPGMDDMWYSTLQGSLDSGNPTTLIWVEFGSDIDLGEQFAINEGAVLSLPSMDWWSSTFDADTWNGGNLFPTAMYNPDPFGLTMFQFEPPQTFPPRPDIPGMVMRYENYLIIGVDTTALTAYDPLGTIGFGFHMHHSPGPFEPGIVSGYPAPRARTPESFPTLATNEPLTPGTYCCYVDPVEDTPDEEVTSVEEDPTDEPAEEVVDEPGDEVTDDGPTAEVTVPADDELPDGGNLEDGSFRKWVPITLVIFGVAVMAGGFWIYYRTRERGRPGTGGGGETAPGEEEGDDNDPRDVAVPGGQVEHTTCDWELHYWTGAKWEVLRAASSHKCCVYKVRVETKVRRHEQVAKFRQDVKPERLYIPDLDFAWRAMNFDANTSTRSGPEGRLDWMQGMGDPIDLSGQAPDEAYWQKAQGEEQPEIAAHLLHDETTRIKVTLESGCTDPVNTYESSGDSSLTVLSTHECTNHDPAPECPVELNAFGWHWGEVWGELDWVVFDAQSTDPDELERLTTERSELDPEQRSDISASTSASRTWDSHDHDTRDRMTYEGGDYDSGSDTKKGMNWTTWVRTEVELDAAQLVPEHVWPTTQRVSTHIEQKMAHTIKVGGIMKKGDCESTGCCTGNPGHVCECAPEFELTVDNAGSRIVVDGNTFSIERDPASADRNSPPATPSAYGAWKLV